MRDRLLELLQEHRALADERKQLLAELKSGSASTRQIRDQLLELSRQSRERLERARKRHPAPTSTPSPAMAAAALQAAIDAYDRAFGAPSVHGLPSAAAFEAYLAIWPEPEPVIRAKLEAALALRRPAPHSSGSRAH
jgi:cell division septum initiation protein DivIVA